MYVNNCFNLMCVDTGNRIITEGEYVEMTGITKDMSGSYDCITSNDISPPDVRTVQVTVNCEYLILSKFLLTPSNMLL